jgi:eukaryotic-like serine/threonine-protein kinase
MVGSVALVRTGQLVSGRYLLLRQLGAGGLSRVWLAHDQVEQRSVAIKRGGALPDGITPGDADLYRSWVLREARELSRIQHPNVVRTLDVLPDEGAPWIVMEYVESRSLQEVIDESGPLPPIRVASIGLAVLDALRAVRRAGLLHLDVKPSNVLIAANGHVVLTDFSPAVTPDGIRALAGAGIVFGSPKYLAPERIIDGRALPESDLWSLGATLYHAVEGRPPFDRSSVDEILHALIEEQPDPAVRAGPLAPVLEGLMRQDPAARLTAAEVDVELCEVIWPTPVEPEPEPVWPALPSRSRLRFAVLAALLTALLALANLWASNTPADRSGATHPPAAALPADSP